MELKQIITPNINEQTITRTWNSYILLIQKTKLKSLTLPWACMGLSGEIVELWEAIDNNNNDEIHAEIGDVFWYLIFCSEQLKKHKIFTNKLLLLQPKPVNYHKKYHFFNLLCNTANFLNACKKLNRPIRKNTKDNIEFWLNKCFISLGIFITILEIDVEKAYKLQKKKLFTSEHPCSIRRSPDLKQIRLLGVVLLVCIYLVSLILNQLNNDL